ncbi:MAG TPA: alkaline phosphatase family protein [Phycisphaerae bacterium]|nr:alkaline phosphatase family protein [Phycisphaerae bacterium]
MTDLERVLGWFECGRLVRPREESRNFVDLVRALLRLAGASDVPGGEGAEELEGRVGPAEHHLLVLVDGLGANQLERLFAPDGFARRHLAGRLQAVWPSTTATALTTLATGQWPCTHGVPGWWTYLDEHDVTAVTLPFEQRLTEQPLGRLGVRPEELYPAPSAWPKVTRRPRTVLPEKLVDSAYSTYARGGTAGAGYKELAELPDRIRRIVRRAAGATLTHLYLPQLDSLSHKKGTDSAEVRLFVPALDALLADLADAVGGVGRLVVTADHGHVNAPRDRWTFLPPTDPLAQMLRCRPTGEPAVPIFHVTDGLAGEFAAAFRERFGEHFALLTVGEVERLRLTGPHLLSPVMRRRLGTFVGISPAPAKLYVLPADPGAGNLGVHGGLSNDEMHVPLILA